MNNCLIGVVGSATRLMVRLCVLCIKWGLTVRDILRNGGFDSESKSKKRILWGDVDISWTDELLKGIDLVLKACSHEPFTETVSDVFDTMKQACMTSIDYMNSRRRQATNDIPTNTIDDYGLSMETDSLKDGGDEESNQRSSKRASRGSNKREDYSGTTSKRAKTSNTIATKSVTVCFIPFHLSHSYEDVLLLCL